MRPAVSAAEYAGRWEAGDLLRVGQYSRQEVRTTLWPWLKGRNYAEHADDDVLEEWLGAYLGERPAFMRPGLRLKRRWAANGLSAPRGRAALAAAIRNDVDANPRRGRRAAAPRDTANGRAERRMMASPFERTSAAPVEHGFSRAWLEQRSFRGFFSFAMLRRVGLGVVPDSAGVYVVVRGSDAPPVFLERNPAGRFKGRDPTLPVLTLTERWIADSQTIYIGKAERLRRRFGQRLDFGAGKPVGAWGGRCIWQLGNAEELLVAWKSCGPDEHAAALEAALLAEFDREFGRAPYANLRAWPALRLASSGGMRTPILCLRVPDERGFHKAMLGLYKEAKREGYTASYFLQMLSEHGGLDTAKRLINSASPSEGFGRLYELSRLDLSVEALALEPEWSDLFTAEELRRSRERLSSYGFRK